MTITPRDLTLPGHEWSPATIGGEPEVWHLVRLDRPDASPLSGRACRASAVERVPVTMAGLSLCAACLCRLLCPEWDRTVIYG